MPQITRNRVSKNDRKLAFDVCRLSILIKGCTDDIPHDKKGESIGKSYSTFMSRVAKPGELTLDEIATFTAYRYCPEDAVIEAVSAYLKAKAEMAGRK